jgi:hypothetical protein
MFNTFATVYTKRFDMNVISVREVIGGEFAICCEDGTKVYDLIKGCLEEKQAVVLDFSDIKICVAPFLSFAIGRLFADFEAEDVQKIVDSIINLKPLHKSTLDICVEDYRRYYSDAEFRKMVDSVVYKTFEDLADGIR